MHDKVVQVEFSNDVCFLIDVTSGHVLEHGEVNEVTSKVLNTGLYGDAVRDGRAKVVVVDDADAANRILWNREFALAYLIRGGTLEIEYRRNIKSGATFFWSAKAPPPPGSVVISKDEMSRHWKCDEEDTPVDSLWKTAHDSALKLQDASRQLQQWLGPNSLTEPFLTDLELTATKIASGIRERMSVAGVGEKFK